MEFSPTAAYAAAVSDELRHRAQKGYAFAEANLPDWPSRVDMRTFDIGDNDACLLAQYAGKPFQIAARELEMGHHDVVRLGLFVEPRAGMTDEEQRWRYDLLTEHWIDLLAGVGVPDELPDYRPERKLEHA